MMKKIYSLIGFSVVAVALTACQTAPREFNGMTGYQIESQGENTATLAYTLAGRADLKLDENKLQRACQKTLNSTQVYKINILSTNEIMNPSLGLRSEEAIKLGQSRTSFGLSNTPNLNSNEDFATRQALESKPSSLQVVRYTCS